MKDSQKNIFIQREWKRETGTQSEKQRGGGKKEVKRKWKRERNVQLS